MSQVMVQRVNEIEKQHLPLFEELGRRLQEIRNRAYELFERRGYGNGDDLNDWLQAERDVMGVNPAELNETAEAYNIRMDIPGIDAREMNVTAASNEIVVQASTRREQMETRGGSPSRMYSSSDLLRRFELQRPIDPGRVTARLNQSTLEITAPKTGQYTQQQTAGA